MEIFGISYFLRDFFLNFAFGVAHSGEIDRILIGAFGDRGNEEARR